MKRPAERMRTLSPSDAAALMLLDEEKFTHADVAESYGCSPETVRHDLHQARVAIRALVAQSTTRTTSTDPLDAMFHKTAQRRRDIYDWHFKQNLSAADIANRLAVSEATIRTMLAKMR